MQLHEGDVRRPSRERFQSERAASSKQIQHPGIQDGGAKNTHPRLAHPVGSWTDPFILGEDQSASTKLPGDDSHGAGRSTRDVRCEGAELGLQTGQPVVLVAFDAKGGVHQPIAQPGDPICPLESDGPEPGASIVQGTLQMPAAHHTPVGEPNAADSKHRAGIALAAGLQIPAEPFEVAGDLVKTDLEVDPLLRTEIVWPERLTGSVAEALAKRIQSSAANGEPRGHMVPAVALQQIAAGEQRIVEVEAGGAAA